MSVCVWQFATLNNLDKLDFDNQCQINRELSSIFNITLALSSATIVLYSMYRCVDRFFVHITTITPTYMCAQPHTTNTITCSKELCVLDIQLLYVLCTYFATHFTSSTM